MIETEKGRVEDFLVQIELLYRGRWRACIRYNYAHGRPHRDLLYSGGEKKKEWLGQLDLGSLIHRAQKDLSENFDTYLHQMGYD